METIANRILGFLKESKNREYRPRKLARQLDLAGDADYGTFRDALRELMHQGRVTLGAGGSVVLPTQKSSTGLIVGTFRQNRKGFGFVIPTDPTSHEDLYIPSGFANGALSGDVVSAKIVSSRRKDDKTLFEGRILEVIQRTHTRFVGTLVKDGGQWMMVPDGNVVMEPILTPDAAGRPIKQGVKVVVEMTTWPDGETPAQGVIVEVLGKPGEKDVDLKCIIAQYDLPQAFNDECQRQARNQVAVFNAECVKGNFPGRVDLSNKVICTIDPDDAKDYDDAISLEKLSDERWELGVHIADVSHFIPLGSALDVEAQERGNSAYFPGFVIPMLPEALSNGVCSLQEGVPRFCKSAFVTLDDEGKTISARFANTVIRSANRLRYKEAQAIIDGSNEIPHPDGNRKLTDYKPEVIDLLGKMNQLAKKIQKRRLAEGQIVLELPEIDLVLDENGKVTGTKEEDTSFTHTLIEMFMVEANEAVARMLDANNTPFLRRIHPDPEPTSAERLRHFVTVAGYKLPKELDRKAIQTLLATVKGKPESFALNLAALRSLARAEYSPKVVGHYALASEHYTHFTSPIRRYADLMIHRLLDEYIQIKGGGMVPMPMGKRVVLEHAIPDEELAKIGKQISFTERRAEDAEKELRQVKVLELLTGQLGTAFNGVITGITNFGLFVQIREYLIDGLVRYEDLGDDWWKVDEKAGRVSGERSGIRLGIGDVVKILIAKVDVPRRQLDLAIIDLKKKPAKPVVQLQKSGPVGHGRADGHARPGGHKKHGGHGKPGGHGGSGGHRGHSGQSGPKKKNKQAKQGKRGRR